MNKAEQNKLSRFIKALGNNRVVYVVLHKDIFSLVDATIDKVFTRTEYYQDKQGNVSSDVVIDDILVKTPDGFFREVSHNNVFLTERAAVKCCDRYNQWAKEVSEL